jgi:hypothetical protein
MLRAPASPVRLILTATSIPDVCLPHAQRSCATLSTQGQRIGDMLVYHQFSNREITLILRSPERKV